MNKPVENLLNTADETTIIDRPGRVSMAFSGDGVLTPGDRAVIREIVHEIVDSAMPRAIEIHVDSCPWGRRLSALIYLCIGVGIGSGLLSAGAIMALVGR